MKKVTAAQAFSIAWDTFKKNPLQHVGIFFLMMLISGLFSSTKQHSLLMTILGLIVQTAVGLFLYGYSLDTVRNRYESLNAVFTKYVTGQNFVNLLIYNFLMLLGAIALMFPVMGAVFLGASSSSFGGGSASIIVLVGLIIFIYIALRLFFASYLIIEGYGVADAIKISWERTSPYIGEILIFIIAAVIAMFLGLIALIIGIFVAIPVVYFAQAVFYNEVFKEDKVPATEE